MASAPVKAPVASSDADAASSNKTNELPLTTIEEARDESFSIMTEMVIEAREDASAEPASGTPAVEVQEREKADSIKADSDDETAKNDQPSASASVATPTSTVEKTNDSSSKPHRGFSLKQKVLSLRKGKKSLLRKKNSKSPVVELPSEEPQVASLIINESTKSDQVENAEPSPFPEAQVTQPQVTQPQVTQPPSPRSSPTWSLQSYIPNEIAFDPDAATVGNDDGSTVVNDTAAPPAAEAAEVPPMGKLLQDLGESIRKLDLADLADLGDYAISEYERAFERAMSSTHADKLKFALELAGNTLGNNAFDYSVGFEGDDTIGEETFGEETVTLDEDTLTCEDTASLE